MTFTSTHQSIGIERSVREADKDLVRAQQLLRIRNDERRKALLQWDSEVTIHSLQKVLHQVPKLSDRVRRM